MGKNEISNQVSMIEKLQHLSAEWRNLNRKKKTNFMNMIAELLNNDPNVHAISVFILFHPMKFQ